jgi:hypothetical protein
MKARLRRVLRSLGLVAVAALIGVGIAVGVGAPDLFRGAAPAYRAVLLPHLYPKPEFVYRNTDGRVVEITETSITLTDGVTQRTFNLSPALAAGRYDRPWMYDCPDPANGGAYGCQYRASDVRVGDRVATHYSRVAGVDIGVDICDDISILRRPGGRVPPMPGDKPGHPLPFHEKMNMLQDFEEKGIPLPRRFRYNGTPPPERELAPPPRAAK